MTSGLWQSGNRGMEWCKRFFLLQVSRASPWDATKENRLCFQQDFIHFYSLHGRVHLTAGKSPVAGDFSRYRYWARCGYRSGKRCFLIQNSKIQNSNFFKKTATATVKTVRWTLLHGWLPSLITTSSYHLQRLGLDWWVLGKLLSLATG